MELRDSTIALIQRLEEETGLAVQVTAVASLDTLATVKMARGGQAMHHVMFNPMADAAPDYLICRDCAFALRQYAPPPDDRVELAPSDVGRARVEEQLRAPKGPVHRYHLDDERVTTLRDKLYGGMMLQLKTTPVGIRVDEWLLEEYPDLSDLQQGHARQRILDDMQMLSEEVRSLTPPRPLMASLAMNAAFAEFWSRRWQEPELVEPYRAPGSFRDGRALLRISDSLPKDPGSDKALVDEWARMLGLSDWYQWRTFPTPSPSPAKPA